jgi:serine/threonine protein phosphatase PrpC
MKLTIEARSDVGRVRELNEDSYSVVAECNAVIVCDGMGGHAAGEVASSTAAETIADLVRDRPEQIVDLLAAARDAPLPRHAAALALAVRVANRRVYNAAARSHKLRGMGTTVVAASFEDGVVATAHVGDSRAYRIADGKIEQLTTDHSWIAELVQTGQVKPEDAESFADKNVITRALGTRPNVQVDVGLFPARPGELYLLCSDGLCGYVSDAEILATVTRHYSDPAAAAAALVDAANAAGGLDNSTVAIVRIDDAGGTAPSYSEGSVTLAEESELELESMDHFIAKRFGAEETARPSQAQSRQPEAEAPETEQEPRTEPESEDVVEAAPPARARGKFPWGWVVLLAFLAVMAALMLWPRLISPHDQASGEALIYVVAAGEQRESKVYWDDVYQGTIADLEAGLLVTAGKHRLVVVARDGGTLLDERFAVAANDTLDFRVH